MVLPVIPIPAKAVIERSALVIVSFRVSENTPAVAPLSPKIPPPLPGADKRIEPPEIVNFWLGELVPRPILLPKYAFPVVVAPPLIVSPPFWLPLPIVDDAVAYKPFVKPMSVEVAFDADVPKVDGVNGNEKMVPVVR